MKEIWKDIPDYEKCYQISNLGNVKSLARHIINSGNRLKKETIMKLTPDKDGYLQVGLSKNGITKEYKVHRLVAMCFIDNEENKRTVNHKNGNKKDNSTYNLEWATDKEQMKHARKILGWKSEGNKNYRKVKRSDGKIYNSIKEASIDNNVSASNITMCCQGKCKRIKGFKWQYI